MWHSAFPLAEVSDSNLRRVELDGRAVCIGIVNGEPRAIADTCPHRGAALSEGLFRDGWVTCPSHLWRFSLIDGVKQGDENTRVAVYPTRVVDGVVHVDIPPAATPRSMREILLAHARGETTEEGA